MLFSLLPARVKSVRYELLSFLDLFMSSVCMTTFLQWLHPDPVIIHLGRDSSDSSDEEEVTGHVQRVPIQARPLVVQPSRSSTPPQMATSSRGSTTAGLGGLSVDALLKSVRYGVEVRLTYPVIEVS